MYLGKEIESRMNKLLIDAIKQMKATMDGGPNEICILTAVQATIIYRLLIEHYGLILPKED